MSANNGLIGNRAVTAILAVTGVLTVSSGIAGLVWWFYQRLNRATRLDSLKDGFQNVEQLYTTIETLRRDIEELKASKSSLKSTYNGSEGGTTSSKRTKLVRFKKTASVVSLDETEYQSVWSGTEDSSDEFFDFSESEDFQDELSSNNAVSSNDEALQIFEQVDNLLEASSDEHHRAMELMSRYEAEYTYNVEFLWRMAKCYRMMAQASSDEGVKKEKSFKAVEYAKKAILADDCNAEAHKWFAIATGSVGDYLGVAEKIHNGFTFKEHIDKAMQINPSDSSLHHLLGRFCYEVSMLSWIERKMAAALYSSLPTGTVEEALAHFLRSEQLRIKPWRENRHYLARCYIQLGRYSDAIHWIDQALHVVPTTIEERNAQEELHALQRKYSGYRR